ncbi:hypothetical protein [Streptomyces sp. NPDC091371]|uniref:hypothetical protein n=1 Tax=Streptomyces sp. NPDC091371 TaxID=3155303 RepID=UPI00344793D0
MLRQVQQRCRDTGNTQRHEGEARNLESELKPVHDGLPSETAALAQALRDLFSGLGVSIRRYAARRAYDSSTVSRYLSGQRLPRWEFVLNLLHDVAESRGTAPTKETIGMLRTLHTAAWQTGNSPVHKVELLERKLAAADREAQSALSRERWLEDTLEDREHRIRDLEMRYRELQAGTASTGSVDGGADADGGPRDEQAWLRAEIRDLKEELARVRALHREAEERCERLERELAEAEKTATRNGAPLLPAPQEQIDGGLSLQSMPAGRESSPTIQFGHVNGGVTVFTDSWQVDEEFVSSVSVRIQDAEGDIGNGLLFDRETVIALGSTKNRPELFSPAAPVKVIIGEKSVQGTLVEKHSTVPSPGGSRTLRLVVLRLSEPVPFPDRPWNYDSRVMPGTQLMASAHVPEYGAYSCVLDVKGRSGDWLRVSGEVAPGLIGAPAFSSSGSLVGLVALYSTSENGGLLLPVRALRELTTLKLDL